MDPSERAAQWNKDHPERRLAIQAKYREARREEARARTQAWREEHREQDRENARRWQRAHRSQRNMRNRLRARGLTEEQYLDMHERQGYACAICGAEVQLHIDHDHETDTVRLLLCPDCNRGLGQFQDSPELLRQAALYLDLYGRREATISPSGVQDYPG